MCESVDLFLYNRQTLQGKRVNNYMIIASIISTYLQLVHALLIICQFLVFLALKQFAFGSFLIVWNLIPELGSTENKSVRTVFRASDFRKA